MFASALRLLLRLRWHHHIGFTRVSSEVLCSLMYFLGRFYYPLRGLLFLSTRYNNGEPEEKAWLP